MDIGLENNQPVYWSLFKSFSTQEILSPQREMSKKHELILIQTIIQWHHCKGVIFEYTWNMCNLTSVEILLTDTIFSVIRILWMVQSPLILKIVTHCTLLWVSETLLCAIIKIVKTFLYVESHRDDNVLELITWETWWKVR